MTTWTNAELEKIGTAEELEIAPRRRDGTLRKPVPIWVVRLGDDLYVRSYRGSEGSWYQAAQAHGEAHIRAGGVEKDVAITDADPALNDRIDEAYRTKYGRYPQYVAPMVAPSARATTIRLVPRAQSA